MGKLERRCIAREIVVLASVSLLLPGNLSLYAKAELDDKPVAKIQAILVDGKADGEAIGVSEVEVKRAKTGNAELGTVGMDLFQGDEVTTGEKATVSLLFTKPGPPSRVEVLLKQNSKVKISSIFGYIGTLFFGGPGIFDTQTKYVQLRKRGTEFQIDVSENGDVKLRVLRGEVDVKREKYNESSHANPHDEQPRATTRRGVNEFRDPSRLIAPQNAKTVGALQKLDIERNKPLTDPLRLPTPEADSVLQWTDNLILASMPTTTPRNVIPSNSVYADLTRAFGEARRKAILSPDAISLKTLGDTYKDLGEGRRALEEYKEAGDVDANLKKSAAFLANQAEAYRLAGNLNKAEEVSKEARNRALGDGDSNTELLASNVLGNVYYDKAIDSIARKQGKAANEFFKESQAAYGTAEETAKRIDSPHYEIVQSNLTNAKRAFGPDPTAPLEFSLNGTYRGSLFFPDQNIRGQSVLVITGDRFTLLSCSQPLTGRLINRSLSAAGSLVDFVFDAKTRIKSVLLKAVFLDRKRVNLESAPGEKNQFTFSTKRAEPKPTCYGTLMLGSAH